jgi:hypothetical protein
MGEAKRRKEQFRKTLPTCVFCGVRTATTRDHVPPKALFVPPRPPLIAVPACEFCNNGMSAQEEEFKVFISAKNGLFTQSAANFWRNGGYRSVQKNNRLRKTLLSGTPLWLRSSSGFFEQVRTFTWARESHDPVIEKITRGLYFYHYNTALPPSVVVEVTFLNSFDRRLTDVAGQLNRSNVGGVERFAYLFGRVAEDPEVSLWFFQFYSRHWAAAITKPSAADAAVEADADRWSARASEFAQAAGERCDAENVDRWLDESEPPDIDEWGKENPAARAELRRLARERVGF